MVFSINSILGDTTSISETVHLYLDLFSYIALFPMMPRFIISVREMYDHGIGGRRRWQGVDTGFGASSQPNGSQSATMSAIGFADALGQDRVAEGNANEWEAIRLELSGDIASQV